VAERHKKASMGRSDEQLVEACLGGEVAAFDILVERWQRKIRGAVYRVVRSEEEAQDICQEAFLKAFRGLHAFKQESRFSSWLYQIALNLSRDRLRRRKTRNWVSLDDLDEGVPPGSQRAPAEGERWVEVLELQERVASAVAALPEEQREAVILKEYQGLTFPEIAEIQGVPVSTVKTRLYRGLSVLRERLVRQGLEGPLEQEKTYAVQRPW
jgi:RNA polymerase sigma-70 factor, ECF subfamily